MRITIKKIKLLTPVLITILFILCIIGPEFKDLPRYTWILSGVGLLTFGDKKFVKYIGLRSKVNIYYYLYLGICIFLALIPPIINQTNDFSYITLLMGIVLNTLRGILLIYVLYKQDKNNLLENFIEYLLNACCVCVLFTILFIIFPDFKDFWCNEILANPYTSNYSYYEFRYSISGFAAFSMASIFSFASVLSGYMLAKDEKVNQWHIVKFIVAVVGCFFYGRIAIIGVLLGIFLFIRQKSYGMKTVKILFCLTIFIVILLFLLNYLASVNDQFFYWRKWAFSLISDLIFEGEISDYSAERLLEMYWLPEIKTLLLGDGYYTDPLSGRYYMSTDSGIMRVVLYAGFGGLVLFWGLLLFLFRHSYLMTREKIERQLLIYSIVLWGILELKGESYQRMLMFIYPIYLCLLCKNRRIRR